MSEMREYEAIIAYLKATGTPHRVTSTTGGQHAPGSYHYQGCAVDLAGPAPSRNSPELLAIFAAFGPAESQLAELVYAGAPYNIKDGRRVPPYAVSAHHDHVHVAVRPGTFLVPPGVDMTKIIAFQATATGQGYWFLTEDGGLFAFGDARYAGRIEWRDGAWRAVYPK